MHEKFAELIVVFVIYPEEFAQNNGLLVYRALT